MRFRIPFLAAVFLALSLATGGTLATGETPVPQNNPAMDENLSLTAEPPALLNRLTTPQLTAIANGLVEKYSECWENRDAACFLSLYTEHATIYRNKIENGREVRRDLYHGKVDILKGKLSRRNLALGKIAIEFKDVQGAGADDTMGILFLQDFKNFSPEGAEVYHDEVIKFIVMKNINGHWAVDYEDSIAFRPGEYAEKRAEAMKRLMALVAPKGIREEHMEPLILGTPAPTPTPAPKNSLNSPTPTPTPVDLSGNVVFHVTTENGGGPLPGVKTDVTTTRSEVLDTFYTGAGGMVAVPRKYAANEKYFENYLFFYKDGFVTGSFYKYSYQVAQPEEVLLKLVKPLIIDQQVTVAPGKTLQSYAQYYYGAAVYWKELLFHNQSVLCSDTRLPKYLKLPPVDVLDSYKHQAIEVYYQDHKLSDLHEVTLKFFGAVWPVPNLKADKKVEVVSAPPAGVGGYSPDYGALYKVSLPVRE